MGLLLALAGVTGAYVGAAELSKRKFYGRQVRPAMAR